MKQINNFLAGIGLLMIGTACAGSRPKDVTPDEAAKLDRKLVKDAVVYETGTREGAIVPEIAAPRLRAILVPERVDGNRLIEKHREWLLEGDTAILGIPNTGQKAGIKQ